MNAVRDFWRGWLFGTKLALLVVFVFSALTAVTSLLICVLLMGADMAQVMESRLAESIALRACGWMIMSGCVAIVSGIIAQIWSEESK